MTIIKTITHRDTNKTNEYFPVRKNAITALMKCKICISIATFYWYMSYKQLRQEKLRKLQCIQFLEEIFCGYPKGLSIVASPHLHHEPHNLQKQNKSTPSSDKKRASQYSNLYSVLSSSGKQRLITHNRTFSAFVYISIKK